MAQETELQKLHELIEEAKIGMMTTRRADGHLVSRAMANQRRAPGADLWFVTSSDSHKLDELERDPHVNLSYAGKSRYEWISVSGVAKLTRDRALLAELYEKDWKAWFGEEGDPRHGTPEDPRMVLIGVDIHSAVFLEIDKPRPVVLFELVKGMITGETVEPGKLHRVGAAAAKRPARRTRAATPVAKRPVRKAARKPTSRPAKRKPSRRPD